MKTGRKASIVKGKANWVRQNTTAVYKTGLDFWLHQSYHVDAPRIFGGRKDESYDR